MVSLSPSAKQRNFSRQYGPNVCQSFASANKPISQFHHIPPFFHEFLNRLRQLTAEYAAELSKISGSQNQQFSQRQDTLYAKRSFPSQMVGTKTEQNARKKRRKTTGNAENAKIVPANQLIQNEASTSSNSSRLPPIPEKLIEAQKQQQSQPINAHLQSCSPPISQLQKQKEGQRNCEQQLPLGSSSSPFAQRRKGKEPLSIRQRLDSSLAAAASAVNEQMPLDQLERTVSNVLPASIVESQDFMAYLREYLEEFDRELGQEPEFICEQKEEGNGPKMGEFVQPKPERFVVIDEDEDEEEELEVDGGNEQMEMEELDDQQRRVMEMGDLAPKETAFQIKLVETDRLEVMDQGKVILRTPDKKQVKNAELRQPSTTPKQRQKQSPRSSIVHISPKLISQRILSRSASKGAKIAARKGGGEKKLNSTEMKGAEGNNVGKGMNGRQKERIESKIGPSSSFTKKGESQKNRPQNERMEIEEEQMIGRIEPEMIDQILNMMHSK